MRSNLLVDLTEPTADPAALAAYRARHPCGHDHSKAQVRSILAPKKSGGAARPRTAKTHGLGARSPAVARCVVGQSLAVRLSKTKECGQAPRKLQDTYGFRATRLTENDAETPQTEAHRRSAGLRTPRAPRSSTCV